MTSPSLPPFERTLDTMYLAARGMGYMQFEVPQGFDSRVIGPLFDSANRLTPALDRNAYLAVMGLIGQVIITEGEGESQRTTLIGAATPGSQPRLTISLGRDQGRILTCDVTAAKKIPSRSNPRPPEYMLMHVPAAVFLADAAGVVPPDIMAQPAMRATVRLAEEIGAFLLRTKLFFGPDA